MIDASVARRYARALIEVASQQGLHEQIGEELQVIAAALSAPEARAVFANPVYGNAQRRGLVRELAGKLKVSPVFADFLGLLVDRERIGHLEVIARVYRELLDEKVGRVRAVVTSALPLSQADLARVRDALAAATRKSVSIEARTDPALIGGLIAEAAGTVWDGSLRTQLERLRDQLKQAPL